MTMPRRITLASPAEPSGASWLLNCLLELGIRIEHRPAEARLWRSGTSEPSIWPEPSIWIVEKGRFRLHPRAEVLGKWMPALLTHAEFTFRDDVYVDYRQDLPLAGQGLQTPDATVALFLRDPRDALHSMYARRKPGHSFADYLRFPNPETLLSAADHWLLHAESWGALAGGRVYTFEAYKRDAQGLLSSILAALDLPEPPERIAMAVAASGIEQAKAAEALYRARYPGDTEIANRAGLVGDWKNLPDGAAAMAGIAARSAGTMRHYGWQTDVPADQTPVGVAQSHFLPVFQNLLRPALLQGHDRRDPMSDPSVAQVHEVIARLDTHTLTAAGLSAVESRHLLASLDTFVEAHAAAQKDRLARMRAEFRDGGTVHMQTLKDLFRRRRATPPSDQA